MFILTVFALALQTLAPYIFWPSRWNIPAHLGVGFCVTAYIVPGLFTNVWELVSPETNTLYFFINSVGAIALVCGMAFGFYSSSYKWLNKKVRSLAYPLLNMKVVTRRIIVLAVASSIGLILAYIIMGFVPMFAAEPLYAKQFKGQYFEPYQRAAYLFRFSFAVMLAVMPLVMVLWWQTKRRMYLFLGISMMLLMVVSLARGASLSGLIVFIGIIAARKRWSGMTYVSFLAIVFPIGSASYLILGLLLGVENFGTIYSLDSVASIIASGTPDIADQIVFLDGFSHTSPFTFGRTMFGGLVPSNYMWNPSVWTLTYDNVGADISEIVSGGLRLTVAMWGYVNFSWAGVIIIPGISGFITGVFLRTLKGFNFKDSPICAGLIIILYMAVGGFVIEFYMLSIHSLPRIVAVLFICLGAGVAVGSRNSAYSAGSIKG